MTDHDHRVFLTGATSYVGVRLLRALKDHGCRVRCPLQSSPPPHTPVSNTTEEVPVDLRDPESLRASMQGIETAYYLVHPSSSNGPFEGDTCRSAFAFATAASQAGVRRIIYFMGLSRRGKYSGQVCGPEEIGEALRRPGVPVIEFHASLILGAGSLAFEILRELAEKMWVISMPRWTRTQSNPIAVEDLIAYLVAGLEVPVHGNAVFELGGAEQASFSDLLREYARQRGLRRWLVPLPVLMPRLSILSLSMAVPMFARFGQELVASLCAQSPLDGSRAQEAFSVQPKGIREMIHSALATEENSQAQCGEVDDTVLDSKTRGQKETRFGLRIVDSRWLRVPYAPAVAFRPIERIGGKTGWYYADWLWHLRGSLDVLLGGNGLRNGRRDPKTLAAGDPVDLWRVEVIERGHLLRLAAEMKLPGRAWLQFEIDENGAGSRIRQTAIFDPVGLMGLLYWYTLYPAHELIFPGLLNGIARAIPSHLQPGEMPSHNPVTTGL